MKTLIAILLLCCTLPAWAQQPIAYWAQNSNTLASGGNGFTPSSFPQSADVGEGILFLENFDNTTNSNGAYQYIQSFAGTTSNRLDGFPSGGSLSPQVGAGNSNNGMHIVLEVDTTGYQDIQLSWAQRGTSTGFTSRTVEWSVDGSSYNTIAVDSGALGGWQTRSYDVSDVSELNDNSVVYFRITLDGGSGTSGNNRFDNILVSGNLIDDVGRITVYNRDFSTNPLQAGWREVNLSGNETWDWNGSFGNISFAPFIDGSCRENENWLISPAFNLDAQTDERLAIDIARGFGGTNGLEVYYSTEYADDGVINAEDWVLLTTITADDFTTNNVPTRFDGFNELSELEGEVRIGFRYEFSSGNCSTWRLANIEITAEGEHNFADFQCGATTNAIHSIQGAGFQSPMQGAYVQVEAVVVGEFQDTFGGNLGGFFIQTPDALHDENPLTSEGIFVFANGEGPSVNVGDYVRVGGTVAEYFEETQISDVNAVEICGVNQLDSVSPVNFSLPVADFSEFEALEGMWVNTTEALTVSDVYNAVRFGEITVSNGRLFTPTQVALPGDDVAAVMAANARNQILIDNAKTGTNRTPFINGVDGFSEVSASNPIRNGFLVAPEFSGVMGYSFGSYRLRPLQTPEFLEINSRTAAPELNGRGNLRVATFNVENFFTTLSSAGNVCGPNNLSCRGASTQSEFDRQLAKLIATINAMGADVIALTEIENDADDNTLAVLVDALNNSGMYSDWNYVATGWLGTDAIKPGFIYRSSEVEAVGDVAVLDSSVDPDFDTSRQRPALAQTFTALNGTKFTAVALHLRAKSSCPSASDVNGDKGDGQGCWNVWRTLSANALANWLATDPTDSGDADFLLLGDFNAYAMEDPLQALTEAGYVNLAIEANGGSPEVYSYTFMGEAGSLDHAFASPNLAAQVVDARAWHINADEIPAFNYTEGTLMGGFAQKPASFYNADAYRSSDHDPIIIELDLTRSCAPGVGNRPRHPRGKDLPLPQCDKRR